MSGRRSLSEKSVDSEEPVEGFQGGSETRPPDESRVPVSRALIFWGVLALLIGIFSGFVMSTATFIK